MQIVKDAIGGHQLTAAEIDIFHNIRNHHYKIRGKSDRSVVQILYQQFNGANSLTISQSCLELVTRYHLFAPRTVLHRRPHPSNRSFPIAGKGSSASFPRLESVLPNPFAAKRCVGA